MVLCVMEHVGGVEEGLGRNTADIQASPAEGTALLNADGLETQLSGLDSGDVPSGSTAKNDKVCVAT